MADYQEAAIKRSIMAAVQKNQSNSRFSAQAANEPAAVSEILAAYAQRVKTLIDADNGEDTSQREIFEVTVKRLMRQRRDAETAVLPLPQVKLQERERLLREDRAKLKKLRECSEGRLCRQD